ncbi:MAG: alpha/beta hydrolase [Wenzhouxiangella sp.]|jgi:pimeloyl-ACP methyl ester carboxylesterase|nr:alpha/beta hydrolase [Wenzhouxiangella sp.]
MPIWILLIVLLLVAFVFWRLWPEPLARSFQLADRSRGRLRSRRVQVDDLDWHYLEGGHGEPLVLLHGFNADAHHFCRVARHLTAHFRILAPDLPGFGETRASTVEGFSVEDQARAVLDWLDRIGVHHFYLGGNSMGGYIAVAIARLAPERVRALWLLAPGGLHSVKLSAVLAEVADERHNPLVIRDLADFRRLVDYCFVHPPWIPAPLARFLARRSAAQAVQAQRIFDALRYDSTPLEDLAGSVRTPALITWGQADQVLHPQGASVLEQLMPDAQSLIVPSIGHLPMLEAPRNVAEAWVAFTEALARRGTPND